MPLSILHVLGTGGHEGTSVARNVAQLAAHLDPARYRLHAWFLAGDGPLIEELRAVGVEARALRWESGVRDPAGLLRFLSALRLEQFALVHQHFGGRSVRWAIRRSRKATPILVHLHGRVEESSGRLAARAPVWGADALIAVSRAVCAQLPESIPASVVYPGVESGGDPLHFAPGRRQCDADAVVLGTASRLVPVKGLPDLLRALEILCKRRSGIRLEIAGSGIQRAELEESARRANLGSAVSFLGWQADIAPRMRNWDIYVQPSLDEGFGASILEAMAAGLPVVATDVGGIVELVGNGETGVLVPPRDPGRLASALEQLAGDAAARRSMGQAGWRRARDRFGARRMVEEVERVYSDLLARSNSAGA